MSKDELRTLLAQARQQVWEEAAIGIMNFNVGIDIDILRGMTRQDHVRYVSKKFAEWCREQAKKGQP